MTTPTQPLLTTALHAAHRALGARLVDFAGWEMPISYAGTVAEHTAVRRAAGVFDIGHMGRLRVRGSGATAYLESLVTRGVGDIPPGAARYALVCNEQGTILDDIFVYRYAGDDWLLIVNGANRLKIAAWMQQHRPMGVTVEDRTLETGLLAIQGPRTREVLDRLSIALPSPFRLHTFIETVRNGRPVLVARTGYTGEWGVEVMAEHAVVAAVWDEALERGKDLGLVPVGLGARDTLRLEMGYALYGHEIDETTTPLDAGLEWAVDFAKTDFIGKAALSAQRARGLTRRLVGFELIDKGVPRQGHPILADGAPVGVVTSGNLSPSLDKGVGMGYMDAARAVDGAPIEIDIRGKRKRAVIMKPPFYKKGKS
ncbi:MAG TPA: glycine cleavage system aminomethyltransferase GcvT [Nitrospiria bacterium]|nr:glycine cleavage system aminomethyltransferase GcvT [Nitrospiria bacterium]